MSGSGDYISSKAAIAARERSCDRNCAECDFAIDGDSWCEGKVFVVDLLRIPAADVRPVVLCRDCKWCHAGYCEKYDDLIPFGCANKPWEDWFCADGAKREES